MHWILIKCIYWRKGGGWVRVVCGLITQGTPSNKRVKSENRQCLGFTPCSHTINRANQISEPEGFYLLQNGHFIHLSVISGQRNLQPCAHGDCQVIERSSVCERKVSHLKQFKSMLSSDSDILYENLEQRINTMSYNPYICEF